MKALECPQKRFMRDTAKLDLLIVIHKMFINRLPRTMINCCIEQLQRVFSLCTCPTHVLKIILEYIHFLGKVDISFISGYTISLNCGTHHEDIID